MLLYICTIHIYKEVLVMPGFDRRGPEGQGPMTGRGLGDCNPDNRQNNQDAATNPDNRDIEFVRGPGFGRGLGRGFGRGLGRGFGRGCRGRGRGFFGRGRW